LRKPIEVTVVLCAIFGIAGLVIGGVIGFLMKEQVIPQDSGLLGAALCCSGGGIFVMLLPTFVERRLVRHNLSRRDEDYASGFGPTGIHISLEDPRTDSPLKLLAEDVGLLYIHPEAHYLKIDGLSYEYVIRSKDVIALSLHPNRKNVFLSYWTGNEQLSLVVKPRSIWAEVKRQRLGSSRGLFQKIKEALLNPASDPASAS